MRLFNKVSNAFFGCIAFVGLFMPLIGYSTLLTGDTFNIIDMFDFLKGIDPNAETNLLTNLGQYGFKGEAIATAVFFIIMLVCLVAALVLSFVNVPYAVRLAVTGLGFVSYIVAVVCYLRIGNAFVNGVIPTSAITSLVATEDANVLTSLISSFASITKMGISTGVYVGTVSLGVMTVVNLVYVIFRKKFALMDGEPELPQKRKKSKKGKKKKAKA